MKFSHRGANYDDALSMLEVTEREIGNMSRGQKREFTYVRHIPEPLPLRNRQFRSVTYCTAQPTAAESTLTAPRVITVSDRTSLSCKKRELLDELMNSHLQNIQRSLEHRLQVARAKGDQKLVQLLEAESKQMALSLQ
jgi:hypothetical protein